MNRYIKGSFKALIFAAVAWSGIADAASRFDHLKHVDIRDLEKYGSKIQTTYKVQEALRYTWNKDIDVDGLFGPQTERAIKEYQNLRRLSATGKVDDALLADLGLQRVVGLESVAEKLGKSLESNTALYTGTADATTQTISPANNYVRYYKAGAQGPSEGFIDTNSSGTKFYNVTQDPTHTRMNTIFSVELEDIVEEVQDQVFKLNIILFIHDDVSPVGEMSFGHYFRRLQVRVDVSSEDTQTHGVQVLKHIEDIPLGNTQFKIVGDVLDRKVILEETNHGIYKIFPIGVGGFDIQTAPGMDGGVASTTFTFPNAKMKSTQDYQTYSNTRSRINPTYYKARPFLALYANGTNYRGIGLHYQIEDDGLTRGFVSHGCVRVRDKDLYQLDAILNDGPLTEISANIVYDLQGYKHLDHPMPKLNHKYSLKVFSQVATDNNIGDQDWQYLYPAGQQRKCGATTHDVQFVGGGWHTVADSDCLSKHVERKESVQPVIDYIRGTGLVVPQPALSAGLQHHWLEGHYYVNGGYSSSNSINLSNQQPIDLGGGVWGGNDGGFRQNQNNQQIAAEIQWLDQQIREARYNISAYDDYLRANCRFLIKMGTCRQYEEHRNAWVNSLRRFESDRAALMRRW